MLITFDQIIVWIIVGLLGGSLAGLLAKGEKRGFGVWKNLGLGLAGALVGGLLFRLLGLLQSLDGVTISLRDVIAAFVGSILVLLALWLKGRFAPAQ
ncbi:GlsB/YeaQ/YmgE family stress response membrane protein [Hyphomicrobium sp. CS1GBMeth3]|uniref:GlsB/YeaQ/YmgE family stress response membrane protein n=1 Tax=Hyphomicrobium sp. CS1GBMeth3 TaxID=1892845 RepID=UPI0009301C37|nr:GlsB/YeaQ/YmgE family stress response membrane protein [Hyphomicrobium sp. CS1GBMeth3]